MNEKDKMLRGQWYDANFDKHLLLERECAADLCHEITLTKPSDTFKLNKLFSELLPNKDDTATIITPFYCDYGYNIYIGSGSFINRNCYLMDGAIIKIGNHVFIGPNCGLYTATHPLNSMQRNQGLEIAKQIEIGDNVWLGGDVTILPGIKIGNDSIIGAGSVVTKDIPNGVIAVGNPCKVLRNITKEDRIKIKNQENIS